MIRILPRSRFAIVVAAILGFAAMSTLPNNSATQLDGARQYLLDAHWQDFNDATNPGVAIEVAAPGGKTTVLHGAGSTDHPTGSWTAVVSFPPHVEPAILLAVLAKPRAPMPGTAFSDCAIYPISTPDNPEASRSRSNAVGTKLRKPRGIACALQS